MTTSPNRMLGIFFGVVYLLIGGVGFVYTSDVAFFATAGGKLVGIFQVNPFANIVHLAIGVILLIAAFAGVRVSRAVNSTIGTLFLALGIAGLFLVSTTANIFAINAADNVMHFASAAVLLAVGIGADKQARTAATA